LPSIAAETVIRASLLPMMRAIVASARVGKAT
jgi:hypothetical protein